jgi:phosphatidylethanolamine/phosphatidyl-N-methylethanolamine N-methyltransferase
MEGGSAARDARIRRFYARWAGLYDRLAVAPGVQSWRRATADALAPGPGDTVVEMGCGTGANVPELRGRVGPDGRVVGIDLTRAMLGRARSHSDRTGRTIHYLQGDATRPPVDRADALLATFVVGLLPDPAGAVADWCDLVAPGGRVALLNFQRSDRLLATPLNLAFEAFVRFASPGGWRAPSSRADAFEARVQAARTALAERTVDRRFQTFAGGYLGLLSGQVPER